MRFALHPQRIFMPTGIAYNQYVIVNDGKIEAITETKPLDCDVTELEGQTLVPGFIDIHIHGRAGADVMDATPQALQTIADALPKTGVVAWVGTTVTAPWQDIIYALQQVREFCQQPKQVGAKLLGSFLEGPYFTEAYRGSHPTQYLQAPSIAALAELKEVAGDSLIRVALAPEYQGSDEAIQWLTAEGIKTSIAHTSANFEQVTTAHQHGADCGVHLFNGMSGLHHREPGCAGAVLFHDMLAELIADGIHVHPVMMQLAYRMKGYQQLALITDCMRAGGLSDGKYQLGAQMITVTNGEARTDDGSLAGSTCSLDQALRNMIMLAGVPEWEAVQMATSVPAKYVGVDDKLGFIKPGYNASFALLDPQFQIQATLIDGQWQ
ncbi:N-acetylglucosamine-6-phosphate deacetylase [Photobacterium leiognathi]|uniref:N-acetylglucosamine-6-phosphate deacetylase n=2 Tax=Photobacterium leiognathi TaxID=553611 RepID=A0A2T3M6N7_PHOLE|nr:N-acetylglucosamine-6-phosphate deacetylase [Photobacterium leiognathi]KJF95424.1 N-acetylglucosamine-6-phosphate deacetylase [Photobacterium leiognathi]PSV87645.1 N-acetylglucosamine-6-phosphate deacetylase [Photobacterium leiognathi]